MKYQGKTLRHEQKYYINWPEYVILRERLKHCMHRDRNNYEGTSSYHIRSLYFDDVYNSAMEQKEGGVFHRSKYRIRIYNKSDSIIRIEKKEKFAEYISKSTAIISRPQYESIMDGDYSFMLSSDSPLLRDVYIANKTRLLKPCVVVDYVREAFIANEGNVRITFDSRLRAGVNGIDIFDPQLITVDAYPPRLLVLEVKFDDYLPAHIRQIVQPATQYHMAISKYVLCRQKAMQYSGRSELA